ncbi:MAG TPA: hypothetical protein VKR06_11985 [Ktedonosporobacter sp.]|nr:hypothetical protein [Ktedonosporobacter sp.]
MKPLISTAQFTAIAVEPWYEKQEMVKAAQAQGYEATESLLDDWIQKGLVGNAERTWPGRTYGSGSVAWWSSAQFTLFVELLRARQRGKLRIGQLCALPIWRWVYWGERGGVALPQVKRAMTTWVASVQKTTTETERKEVRKAVQKLQGPEASGKLALIDELTSIGTFEKEPDPDLLRYLLQPVAAGFSRSGTVDEREACSDDIEMLATMHPLRLKAFRQYEQRIACLPDPLWEWARTFLLFGQFQGQRMLSQLTQQPRWAARYHRLTLYDVLWGACYDLLTPLSLVALKVMQNQPDHDRWPYLHYLKWQTGEATSRIATTLARSSLLLPDGDHLVYLRNLVAISYQEKIYCFTLDLPLR